MNARFQPPARGWAAQLSLTPFSVASLLLLLLALLVGGASRENATPAAVVELASAVMLPFAGYRVAAESRPGSVLWALLLLSGLALIPVVQLIPLPPGVWTKLPQGGRIEEVLTALGAKPGWRPMTATADLTIRSGVALVTPVTVFLCWLTLSDRQRRTGVVVILLTVLLSLCLGAIQITSAGTGRGYLYSHTNLGALVGFFSNRNHEATLLLCSIPLAAGLVARSEITKGPALVILCLGLVLTVAIAIAASLSRAGLILLGPALLGGFLVVLRSGRFGAPRRWMIWAGVFVMALLSVILVFGLGPVLERFDTNPLEDTRFQAAPVIWKSAVNYLPFGSGLGSFDTVYRSVEPLNALAPAFLNHAHDDYLEVLLEAGVLGVAVLLGFLIWFGAVGWKGWSSSRSGSTMGRAASVAIGLVALHSALDYPLRTLAMSAVFAFCAALMLPSEGQVSRRG